MRNEKKKKVTRTFQADCAHYVRDPVGTCLPFTYLPLTVLPIPDVPAPTRPVLSSIKTALIHVTMMNTPSYARTFPDLMGESCLGERSMLRGAAQRIVRCNVRSVAALRKNGQGRGTKMRAYWTYSARGQGRVHGAKRMKDLLAHRVC